MHDCNHLRDVRTTAGVLSVQSDQVFGQEKVRKLLSNLILYFFIV